MPRLYLALLHLLPRRRRDRYAHEMAAVFASQLGDAHRTRGWLAAGVLWIKEVRGLVKFAARERVAAATSDVGARHPGPRRRWPIADEARWAWRGVRARGWRGALIVGLLAVALGSNAAMFAIADSLVFHREPFPHIDRMVRLDHEVDAPETTSRATAAALLEAWGRQRDLVAAAGGYLSKTVFVSADGTTERVRTLDMTVDFFDVLGIRPQWGRSFTAADLADPGYFPVVIAESLARRHFGQPQRALGQTLDATAGRLAVVGVMDADVAFPDATFQIWRAIDPAGPMTQNFGGVPTLLRLSNSIPIDRVPAAIAERAPAVGAAAGLTTYRVKVQPFSRGVGEERRTTLVVLVGAAFTLLLAACANVTSLELAGAARRVKDNAVHLALGASRGARLRVVALEGSFLVGAAVAAGALLAWLTIDVVAAMLPDSLRLYTANPINVDSRSLLYMMAIAGVAWLIGAVPVAVATSRASLQALRSAGDRSSTASGGMVWLRRALTAGEVAVAVALVIGGLLYVRSYRELLNVDKGFESNGLYQVTWYRPAMGMTGVGDLADRALEAYRAMPGVIAGMDAAPPPSLGDSPGPGPVEIAGRPAGPATMIGAKWVTPDYFEVIPLPLRRGRYLRAGDPETNIVVGEAFAERFFGDADPVGHAFRPSPGHPWHTIVGVVGDFRAERTRLPQPTDTRTFYYKLSPTRPRNAPPPATPLPNQMDTGGMFRFTTITLRTDDTWSPARLAAEARRIEPRLQVSVTDVDAIYAAASADTRLSADVVSAFGALAFVVAMAGIYGVMSFLVAGRTREMGIRLALGAERGAVQRLVLASALRMVAVGAVAGAALALVGSRWIESQLFGISPVDFPTYAMVTMTVVGVSMVAAWWPARQAARVDPAITLKAE